jgi:Zn-dependent membrane protease YugP
MRRGMRRRGVVRRTGLGVDPEAIAVPVETPELKKLGDLRDKGIVTPQEFETKKKQIIDAQGNAVVSRIKLKRTPGQMTDHYDPKTHTVRLSENVVARPSVATMAIVAHELGHAQQHENNSVLITMRNLLVPAVNFSSPLAYICIFLGLLLNLSGLFGLGIIFFALMVLFTIITLPVEFDASRRGLKLLDESGLMQTEPDSQGSKQVLRAAAMTYVAAAVTAVLKLLYFISLSRRGRGRR